MNQKIDEEKVQSCEQLLDFIICLKKASNIMKSKYQPLVDELSGTECDAGGESYD